MLAPRHIERSTGRFTAEECEDYDVGEPIEKFHKGLLGYRTKFRALSFESVDGGASTRPAVRYVRREPLGYYDEPDTSS